MCRGGPETKDTRSVSEHRRATRPPLQQERARPPAASLHSTDGGRKSEGEAFQGPGTARSNAPEVLWDLSAEST